MTLGGITFFLSLYFLHLLMSTFGSRASQSVTWCELSSNLTKNADSDFASVEGSLGFCSADELLLLAAAASLIGNQGLDTF